jgi:hypothetical protein
MYEALIVTDATTGTYYKTTTTYTGPNALTTYFEDPDLDTLTFKVESDTSKVLVRNDSKGNLALDHGAEQTQDDNSIVVDVLASVDDFNLTIYAYDSEGLKSDLPLVLKVDSVGPREHSYTIRQAVSGAFEKQKVGNRIGVEHTVTFTPRDVTLNLDSTENASGFVFAAKHINTLIAQKKIPGTVSGVDSLLIANETEKPGTDPTAFGTSYFTVKANKASVSDLMIAAAPSLKVELSGTSDPTITITHHVWVDKDGSGTGDAGAWVSKPMDLVLDVQACVAFGKCP